MFKQANRNAVLLLIGHGKRISFETNLVVENGCVFLQNSKTTAFLVQNPNQNEGKTRIEIWDRPRILSEQSLEWR